MKAGYYDISGIQIRLDEIVAQYDVWPMGDILPFPRFMVKVVHRAMGNYQAVPNVCVRNVTTGDCEYTCGLGDSADEAVTNAIQNLFSEVQKQSEARPLEDTDFVFNHRGF